MRFCTSVFVLTTALSVIAIQSVEAQNRVELEILVDTNSDPSKRQEWMELLSEAGADSLRMRSARAGDKLKVSSTPSGDYDVIKIVGQLTRNKIVLPGGTFSKRDVGGIRALLNQLRADGAEVTLSEKKAFGLTSKQLVGLHTDLSSSYLQSTKGVSVSEILSNINDKIKTPIGLTDAAKAAIAEDYTFEDELQGLASGTVLAAVARPLGLVVVPTRPQGSEIKLILKSSADADEHWPIGWPNNKPNSQIVPAMYEHFSLRIENIPLRKVLDAIEKKGKVPFVYDYNSLAERDVNLEKGVSLTETRIVRIRALSKLLSGSRQRLNYEIRLDEADKPFIWISTN